MQCHLFCVLICCCLPCIISFRGFNGDLTQNRGAPPESINSLPTYKFKMKKTRNKNGREINSDAGEGGVVAAGTEKERVISGEDVVSSFVILPKLPWLVGHFLVVITWLYE